MKSLIAENSAFKPNGMAHLRVAADFSYRDVDPETWQHLRHISASLESLIGAAVIADVIGHVNEDMPVKIVFIPDGAENNFGRWPTKSYSDVEYTSKETLIAGILAAYRTYLQNHPNALDEYAFDTVVRNVPHLAWYDEPYDEYRACVPLKYAYMDATHVFDVEIGLTAL